MKDVSQELDPDTHKQMEKFRKVRLSHRTGGGIKVGQIGLNDKSCYDKSVSCESMYIFIGNYKALYLYTIYNV